MDAQTALVGFINPTAVRSGLDLAIQEPRRRVRHCPPVEVWWAMPAPYGERMQLIHTKRFSLSTPSIPSIQSA